MKTCRSLIHLAATLLALGLATVSNADAIGDWNQTATRAFNAAPLAGNARARAHAMVNAAMFEAVNAVEGRFSPIVLKLERSAQASPAAAAAAAAYGVLMNAVPNQKAKLDEALAEALKAVPDVAARASGVAIGERAAAGIIADRADDALTAPDTYRPHTTPRRMGADHAADFPEYARAKLWGAMRNDRLPAWPAPGPGQRPVRTATTTR